MIIPAALFAAMHVRPVPIFARLLLPALLIASAGIVPARAEAQAPPLQTAKSPHPVPSQLDLSGPVWNIMAAVDHANQSGNYTVLRDMGAPAFQTANPVTNGGVLRLQGYFGLRPKAINFDLQFQWVAGKWKLLNVGISERGIPQNQPETR